MQLELSCDIPSRDHTWPDRNKTDNDAQNHVQSGDQQLAVLNITERFILERRERRISPDESNWNQVPPVRAPVSSLCKEGKDESNQERTRAIDYECPVRESRSHAVTDIPAKPEPRDRADETSDGHHHVFCSYGLARFSLASL